MKKILIYFILIFLSSIIFQTSDAQTYIPDSINAEKSFNKAIFYSNKKINDSAIFYFNTSAHYYQKINNWNKYLDCKINLGVFYQNLRNYKK